MADDDCHHLSRVSCMADDALPSKRFIFILLISIYLIFSFCFGGNFEKSEDISWENWENIEDSCIRQDDVTVVQDDITMTYDDVYIEEKCIGNLCMTYNTSFTELKDEDFNENFLEDDEDEVRLILHNNVT